MLQGGLPPGKMPWDPPVAGSGSVPGFGPGSALSVHRPDLKHLLIAPAAYNKNIFYSGVYRSSVRLQAVGRVQVVVLARPQVEGQLLSRAHFSRGVSQSVTLGILQAFLSCLCPPLSHLISGPLCEFFLYIFFQLINSRASCIYLLGF